MNQMEIDFYPNVKFNHGYPCGILGDESNGCYGNRR